MTNRNIEFYSSVEFQEWSDRGAMALEFVEERLLKQMLQKPVAKILDCGTGAGRFALQIARMSPDYDITGIDLCKELLDSAQKLLPTELRDRVRYSYMDASKLEFADESFDYLVYLQQVICFIPSSEGRHRALSESYRVLKKGGQATFSFLYYPGRALNPWLSFVLDTKRRVTGSTLPRQMLPWLKLNGRINWKFMKDDMATLYWYTAPEIVSELTSIGYKILSMGTDGSIKGQPNPEQGMIYLRVEK